MTRLIFDLESLGTNAHSVITGYGLLNEDGVTFKHCFISGDGDIDKLEKVMLVNLLKDIKEVSGVTLVGHYIRHFDFPMIISRCLFHGLDVKPFLAVPMIDTWEIARDFMLLPYNTLDDLCHFLGIKKDVTIHGYDMPTLFLKAVRGNKQALLLIEHHCKNDCATTLEVFNRLKPLIGIG